MAASAKLDGVYLRQRTCYLEKILPIISKLKKDSQLLSVLSTILGEEITPTASMNICEQCDSKDAKWRKGKVIGNEIKQQFSANVG